MSVGSWIKRTLSRWRPNDTQMSPLMGPVKSRSSIQECLDAAIDLVNEQIAHQELTITGTIQTREYFEFERAEAVLRGLKELKETLEQIRRYERMN